MNKSLVLATLVSAVALAACSKTEAPAEVPRFVKSEAPELFPAPRKLQAGE